MAASLRVQLAVVPIAMQALLLAGCSEEPVDASAQPCRVALADADGLDLALRGSGTCAFTVDLALRVATGDPTAPVWAAASDAPVKVAGAWVLDGKLARRQVTLQNESGEPVTVLGLEWSSASPIGSGLDRFLHDGYQSWSYTGVEAIGSGPLVDENGTAPHGGEHGDVLLEHYGTSWWWSFLSDPSGHGVVLGADGGTVLKTYVAVDRAPDVRARLVMGMTGDRIELAPGEEKPLDGVVVALGDDVREATESWATRVAELHPPARTPSKPLGGWGSWNLYYADVTAAALRDEAAWAAEELVPLGLEDFLLDDGYETQWGDWAAAPDFGADLATLNAEQSASGLSPAVWLAPIYVDTTDVLLVDHPDWFLRDEAGELIVFDNFGPTYAALDAAVPDARDHVARVFADLRAAGYRSFKIDFLFGAALEGARSAPMTSLEAYGLWMKTIRDATPDAHLVGCGAPMLPSVGWVDSMRTGPDIAFDLLPEPAWDFIASEARHSILRASTGRFWAIDPDVVLLRGNQIDDAEAWTAVVSAALTGGNYLLGDGRQASPLRLAYALAPEVLEMTRDRVAARPLDLGGDVDTVYPVSPVTLGGRPTAIPHLWTKPSADGAITWTAVFAWDVDAYRAKIEWPAGTEEIVPPKSEGETLSRVAISGPMTIDVARHAVRLFRAPSGG